jgi:hypothetical protein
MPLAVGVPVLAALALRDTAVRKARLMAVALAGGALGAAHVLAYAQNLRRYTVGAAGTIWFWTQEAWSRRCRPCSSSSGSSSRPPAG